MRKIIAILVLLWLVNISVAFAQMRPELPADYTKTEKKISQPEGNPIPPDIAGHSIMEIYLSFGVLGFGLGIIVVIAAIMIKKDTGWGEYSTRMLGLTLVITGGLFLITAGYSQNQIAPMMGLLGTVAGYLLGHKKEK